MAAGPQHLLVERLDERLGGGGRLDHGHIARLHLRRVADEDLGERLDAGIVHAASFAVWSRIRPTSHSCRRPSPVSSGWNATASTFPWRTAIGCPSSSASTSTPSPCSSTHGARMNTARMAPAPDMETSASKLCTWRPK